MDYLQNIEAIKAGQVVGTAKAEALKEADLKILANSGNVDGGVNNLLDIFTGKGGTGLASMLENLNNSGIGKDLIAKFIKPKTPVKVTEATAEQK